MNILKEYKQYFTPLDLASFMVNLVPDEIIRTVVDLSMGECGLLEAAKKRWDSAAFFGADIDGTLLDKIHTKSPYIQTFSGNSLGQEIASWVEYQRIAETGFDLAIANPPFNYYDQSGVNVDSQDNAVLPIEIRFLLKYIDIVKDGGYICIILPYGFLSLELYSELRIEILKKVTVFKIIKIFPKCFARIDADTCLLLMKKKRGDNRNIQESISIEYLNETYSLSRPMHICVSGTGSRLDLEYHKLKDSFCEIEKTSQLPIVLLSNYVSNCRRGQTLANKKELIVEKGIRFLHTTDVKHLFISNQSPTYVLKNTSYFEGSVVKARTVLIGRVGRACIGKIAIISGNRVKAVISDCIFALEVREIDPYYLAIYLASKYGQMQLKGLAKGSCSKYLTKSDLLQLKIVVPQMDNQTYFREKYLKIMSLRGGAKRESLLAGLISELDDFIGKR